MGRRAIATALAVVGVGACCATPAGAAVRTVDRDAGPYTTITDALHAAVAGDTIDIHAGRYDEQVWVDKDDITLRGAPGAVVNATSPFALSLMGHRDAVTGLFVGGGPGGVRIEGDGARLTDTTVVADTTAVAIAGPVTTTITRSSIRAADPAGTALQARNEQVGAQATRLTTAIVVGGRRGTALDVGTGPATGAGPVQPTTLQLVFSTVAGAPTALATGSVGGGGAIDVEAYNSIVHGDAPALGGAQIDRAADAATFRDAAAVDLHLRSDAAAVGQAGPLPAAEPWPATDFDGAPLSPLRASLGAFEFFDRPPSAALSAPTDAVRQGVPLSFDASASADPDVGGRIVQYVWAFGDGTPETTTTTPAVRHAFADVGRPVVTVRTVDDHGAATTSAALPITVTDAVAPALSITSPRDRARLHRLRTVLRAGHRRRVVNVVRFGGRATDAGGVERVELTLRRLPPTKTKATRKTAVPGICVFLDPARRRVGTRPCVDPPVIRATRHGDAWSWSTPAGLALPLGTWELTARATDRAGNLATSVLHFTVT